MQESLHESAETGKSVKCVAVQRLASCLIIDGMTLLRQAARTLAKLNKQLGEPGRRLYR